MFKRFLNWIWSEPVPYYYRWHHIPTGRSGKRELICKSRKKFLQTLAKWNMISPSTFRYSEIEESK